MCDDKAELVCAKADFHERPGDEGNAPITLLFTVYAEAEEEGGLFTRSRTCKGYRTVKVELPTGGTIEERFAAAFGDRTRSFAELASLKRGTPRGTPAR